MKLKAISVVGAGMIIMLCLGVAYSWGVFVKPIENDLGWGRAEISLAVSILLLVFSVFMFIGGVLEKKFSASRTVTIAGVLIAIAWIGASFSNSPLFLYIFYGIFGGIATGLSYIPSVSCGIKWYPQKKGLITGIIIFGFGFGTALLSPLMTALIQAVGWRSAMMYSGIVFGSIITVCAQFLEYPEAGVTAASAETTNDKKSLTHIAMLKTSSFWVLFVTYFIAMVAGMMTIGHVVAFAPDQGLTVMQGTLALTILAVFNGLGRIVAGYLSDRFGGNNILVILFLLISGAMFLFATAQNVIIFYLLSALIGLCFGGFLAVYPPLTVNNFGSEYFSINYGLIFIGYGIGCFTGPLMAGWIFDISSSYAIAFYTAAAVSLIGAVIIFLFSIARKKTFPSG